MQEIRTTSLRHGLTFYGTVAFAVAFFGARLFATMNPNVVVVKGGIHFHHFWYGLAMITGTGWIGITTLRNDKLTRQLAIVFGLGAGLIGDEVGLLLTFGDYTSNLTEIFFVAAMAFIILATLISRRREHIEKEVLNVGRKERLTQVGLLVAAFSAIFFAVDDWTIGFLILALGVLLYFWGFERERRPRSLNQHI
ncbi:hypothetical protein J2P12_05190 [Candidatus Bathyarchaeota archaeon]|nr:hypothetical protein [Candidatus Bathyarchaeota archaeon]